MLAVSAEFRLFGCFDEFYCFLVFLRFPHQKRKWLFSVFLRLSHQKKEFAVFRCPFFHTKRPPKRVSGEAHAFRPALTLA